jgi:hypothetical protein
MRIAVTSPIPVVTRSPGNFTLGESWTRYTTLAAIPTASERLTSHNTWSVVLVRNGIACHPGELLRTNKSAALNPMATL